MLCPLAMSSACLAELPEYAPPDDPGRIPPQLHAEEPALGGVHCVVQNEKLRVSATYHYQAAANVPPGSRLPLGETLDFKLVRVRPGTDGADVDFDVLASRSERELVAGPFDEAHQITLDSRPLTEVGKHQVILFATHHDNCCDETNGPFQPQEADWLTWVIEVREAGGACSGLP